MNDRMGATGRPVRYRWDASNNPRDIEVWEPRRLDTLEPGERSFDDGYATAALAATVRRHPRRAGLLALAEGMASSRIENINSHVTNVAFAAHRAPDRSDATLTAANVEVAATAAVHSGPITSSTLLDWHRTLCTHSGLRPTMVGAWRDVIVWIGGGWPEHARFVPPAPEAIPALMVEFCDWLAGLSTDPVTAAGAAHAVFETIHPFADGNGRTGRALLGAVFGAAEGLRTPAPFSCAIARDRARYYAALNAWRNDTEAFWAWMTDTLQHTVTLLERFCAEVDAIEAAWDDAGGRSTRVRAAVADVVFTHGGATAAAVAAAADVTERGVTKAFDALAEAGLLEVSRPWHPPRRGRVPMWWSSPRLDTAIEELAWWP